MAALNASAGLRIKSLLLSLSHCSLYLSFACYPCRIVLCTCPLLLCLCCYRCPLFFVSFLCSCTCSLYLSFACNFTLASATMWATFYDDDLCTCPLLLYLFFVLVLCLQFCIDDDDDCFTHRITLGMCVCVSPSSFLSAFTFPCAGGSQTGSRVLYGCRQVSSSAEQL